MKVTCDDHNGHNSAYVQQWDGTKWVKVSDWISPMKDKVVPLIDKAAADYVKPTPAGRSAPRLATSLRNARVKTILSPPSRRGEARFSECDLCPPSNGTNATPVAPAAQTEHILRVNNIEVIYDHVILVLKGVSLDVPKGGIVALLGANGAGKTTTLKAISNLLHAERGDVTKGASTSKASAVARAVARTNLCGAAASR